jgi:hypothetical protein
MKKAKPAVKQGRKVMGLDGHWKRPQELCRKGNIKFARPLYKVIN